MRKLLVSIHSTVDNVVTGSPTGDETDFGQWAQPGIDESSEMFLAHLEAVDTVVLGRGPTRTCCGSGHRSRSRRVPLSPTPGWSTSTRSSSTRSS